MPPPRSSELVQLSARIPYTAIPSTPSLLHCTPWKARKLELRGIHCALLAMAMAMSGAQVGHNFFNAASAYRRSLHGKCLAWSLLYFRPMYRLQKLWHLRTSVRHVLSDHSAMPELHSLEKEGFVALSLSSLSSFHPSYSAEDFKPMVILDSVGVSTEEFNAIFRKCSACARVMLAAHTKRHSCKGLGLEHSLGGGPLAVCSSYKASK